MTEQENKKRIKAEAFKSIRRIYHPKTKNPYSDYPFDGNYAEQRDGWVQEILDKMNNELNKLKI